MNKLLILGAGTGGTMMANKMRKDLPREDWSITVVDQHKTHYYQRLVEKGWGHKRTVLLEYGVMLICALAAITATIITPGLQWTVIAIIIFMYILITYYIDISLKC